MSQTIQIFPERSMDHQVGTDYTSDVCQVLDIDSLDVVICLGVCDGVVVHAETSNDARYDTAPARTASQRRTS